MTAAADWVSAPMFASRADSSQKWGDLSSPESLESVAATGKAVTPGFISLHTHSDASFLVAP